MTEGTTPRTAGERQNEEEPSVLKDRLLKTKALQVREERTK
jgi:hypothetical protein